MPLFRARPTPDPVVPPPRRSRSFFRRRVTPPPPDATIAPSRRATTASTSPRPGFFSRRSRSTSSLSSSSHGRRDVVNGGGGLFTGPAIKDPTILAAREKVGLAETAEKEADTALALARRAVIEAKRHVQILEREATQEARLAKAKQAAARGLGKSAGKLGRF